MTSKKPDPQQPTHDANRQPSPWRAPTSTAYATGGDDDIVPSFMSALRRFRVRHGLAPTGQTPLLADDDLANLRATDCERPAPDLDDIIA
jgi:hypothetical protein